MHNIHYVVVNAENAREAIKTALNELEDWGNENNWKSAIGVFTRAGEVYVDDLCDSTHFSIKGRTVQKTNRDFTKNLSIPDFGWEPTKETLAKITQTLQELAATDLEPTKLHSYIRRQLKEKNSEPFYKLKKFAEEIYAMADTISVMGKRKTFNLWQDEYRPYEFDEIGVTHCPSDDGEPYCVLVDMHS
jgi:hypothetical protein